jgi:salicylate biosynthesis isochorismate synthase/menaquinone-specific isochorismate synthase
VPGASARARHGRRRPFELTRVGDERLAARLRAAVQRARRSGAQTLTWFSLALDDDVDPTAVACASRRAGEPWFVFEQPDRGCAALVGLGEAVGLQASGGDRFAQVAERWRALSAGAVGERTDSLDDVGPVAVGGFTFAPDGAAAPHWRGFAPASLVVPQVALRRVERDGRRIVRMTLAALASPDDTPEELHAALSERLSELRERPLPLLDPAPAGRFQVASAMPPEHFEAAVARAVELIGGGELEKIVLAREVQVHAPQDYEPAAVLGVLREEFPSCFVFCVGRGDAALVAASPELLVRREGHRVSTLALAGSTRRSADPAVDAHLGEQLLRDEGYREEHAIVARRIERMLRPHAIWVAAAPEPELVRIANIQHLATPIRAQLATPLDALELAGLMHPTPAVGGEPLAGAAPLIPALEGLDRGWYAGPVGWTDLDEDGEFVVGLRCALLRGRVARCYAGVGVVGDSDPAAELAETEIKLQALLPVLAG